MRFFVPHLRTRRTLFAALSIALTAVGCAGPEYEIAEVDGVVTIKGQPGDSLRIEYAPDGSQGGKGPTSTAETDDQGRYTLRYFEREATEPQPGAAVGWHRVTITDRLLSQSATGRGVKIRVPAEYTLIGSTPVKQQVLSGKHSHEISIP